MNHAADLIHAYHKSRKKLSNIGRETQDNFQSSLTVNLFTDSGYECDIRMYTNADVTSWRNAICPTAAYGRWRGEA